VFRTSLLLVLVLGAGAASAQAPAGSGSSREALDAFAEYKEDLLHRFPDMRPRAGDMAIDHTGIDLDGTPIRLADLWARKPVVLEFGTCT
jgi:hypothetical protein